MGRLPKGFKKSAGKPHEVEDEAAPAAAPEHEHAKEEAAKPAHAPAPAAPAPSKPAAKAEEHAAHSDSDDDSDDGGEKGPETRGKMLQRHKKVRTVGRRTVQLFALRIWASPDGARLCDDTHRRWRLTRRWCRS